MYMPGKAWCTHSHCPPTNTSSALKTEELAERWKSLQVHHVFKGVRLGINYPGEIPYVATQLSWSAKLPGMCHKICVLLLPILSSLVILSSPFLLRRRITKIVQGKGQGGKSRKKCVSGVPGSNPHTQLHRCGTPSANPIQQVTFTRNFWTFVPESPWSMACIDHSLFTLQESWNIYTLMKYTNTLILRH